MKKLPLFVAALVLVAPAAVFAAKTDGPKAKLAAKYDVNHNGKLDPDEIAAIQKDFAAAPKGDLARFDTNHDGKLDDTEIAVMMPGSGKKSDKKKTKATPPETAETPAPAAK